MSRFLEPQACPQPDCPVAGVRTEEAARLESAGNHPEAIVGTRAAQLSAARNRAAGCRIGWA